MSAEPALEAIEEMGLTPDEAWDIIHPIMEDALSVVRPLLAIGSRQPPTGRPAPLYCRYTAHQHPPSNPKDTP